MEDLFIAQRAHDELMLLVFIAKNGDEIFSETNINRPFYCLPCHEMTDGYILLNSFYIN